VTVILTVVGYSVNDTIVLYDRIRENAKKHKGRALRDIVNLSINEMLGRTILTSGGHRALAARAPLLRRGDHLGLRRRHAGRHHLGNVLDWYIASPMTIWLEEARRPAQGDCRGPAQGEEAGAAAARSGGALSRHGEDRPRPGCAGVVGSRRHPGPLRRVRQGPRGGPPAKARKLVVFPESFVSGYPDWIWRLRPGPDAKIVSDLHQRLIGQRGGSLPGRSRSAAGGGAGPAASPSSAA